MKIFSVLLFLLIGHFVFANEMICVKIRVGNQYETLAERVLRPLGDQVESGILDFFFEQGKIVTSLKPSLSLILQDKIGVEELGRILFEASSSHANLLIIASLRVQRPKEDGSLLIDGLDIEIHNMDKIESKARKIELKGEKIEKVLKEVSGLVSSLL